MAAGVRTVKIRFTGESKGLDRTARQAESKLSRFAKSITNTIQNVTSSLPDMLSGVVGKLPPQGQAIALAITAGLATSLSAIIGAAITTAVLLAVGGGVLALGIKSAIDNPRVSKAFDGLKTKAKKIFEEFGKPFEQPLIRAAKTFTKVLDSLRPHINKLGQIIAPVIDRLAPALGEFLKRMMPGIQKAAEAAVPLFNTLAKHLPKIGDALNKFFTEISKNGPAANEFFGDLLHFIEGLIIVLGKSISKLASWYLAIKNFVTQAKQRFLEFQIYVLGRLGALLDGAVRALGWIPGIGPKLRAAQKSFREFQANANAELRKIKDRQVKVSVFSNIGSAIANIGNQLDSLQNRRINISGGRASGGTVLSGRSYLVGEKGPEVITMGRNGYVTPNHELGNSQPVVNVYIGDEKLESRMVRVVTEHDRNVKRRAMARG